jgi:oxygen-independent coproporphyrinogen-3 oxidase
VPAQTPLALYLHIPFCSSRCPYCDFNTYAGLESLREPYVAALVEEVRRAGTARSRPPATTIFIGGGTPTVLSPALLKQIVEICHEAFDLARDAEITSEANPGTVDRARFAALREMGVNRLSMGVQSFEDAELRWLGRIHSAAEAEAAFASARAAGFHNINLDFIFGLPEQSLSAWVHTLKRAIALGPEHLSLYSLTVEPGTPLGNQVRRGLIPGPDDDLAADLYLAASTTLEAAGYVQYEISNWARNDRVCQHNLTYWHNEPYLGFGAGAHSYDGQRRWWNVLPIPAYIQRIEARDAPEAGGEIIERRLAMGETMMLGLRVIREGVSDARFRERFGAGLEDVFASQIVRLVGDGLLESSPDRVRLTPRGRLLGNQVFAEFL